MRKLDFGRVAEYELDNAGGESGTADKEIGALQVAIYVACGGGCIGRFGAEQPADFYIDDRVGRLPYRRKEIMQAVKVLETLAACNGYNPHKMPSMPHFHACGIF